jgi:hypothetical protein
MKWSWVIFFLLTILKVHAYEAPLGIRSARGLLMGDAYTAVNNDDFTLFYNPASLARHKRDFSLYPFNPTITVNNILSDIDQFEDLPDTPNGMASEFMNYPIHIGTNVVPGFRLFDFGFSFIANEQVDLLLQNRIHPVLDIDYRSDRGFVAGYALKLGPRRISNKSQNGQQTSLGFSTKYIERKGLYGSYSLTGTDIIDAIDDDADFEETIQSLGMVRGQGWGFDAGLEHMIKNGPHQTVVGIAAMDITGTQFKEEETENNSQVADQTTQVNLGAAYTFDIKYFDFTLSSDIRNLTQEMDFRERLRFGVSVGIPGMRFFAGINSGYYSYGAEINLLFMKITGGFFGVEAGNGYQRIKSDRAVIYVSLFDFSFDA